MPKANNRDAVKECLKNLRYAWRKNRVLFEKYKEDVTAALGKQWDEADEDVLRKVGVEPLTINKIKPIIKLLSGIERQSKSDLVAFPEGQEDSIKAEIATRLIKCVMKKSSGQSKLSAQFKSGIMGGACYVEPYLDYSGDLINGDLKFKKISATNVLVDPDAEEYDHSDAKYVIKLSRNLTKDQLIDLFPDRKSVIEKIELNIFAFDERGELTKIQHEGYKDSEYKQGSVDEDTTHNFDLAEYYYKSKDIKYYVASRDDGKLIEVDSREEADAYAAQIQDSVVIKKEVPQIRRRAFVGETELDDDVAWFYPRWKNYHLIPYFCEWNIEDGVDRELLVQGIVRGLLSLQFEYNKRRTQTLRHLNSSANSGSIIPKNALDSANRTKLEKFGSTPGVIIEFDPVKAGGMSPEQWRIKPMPLSSGHDKLAQENAQDIKEASGVNPDLLANDSESQSGRAILLKQRQGLVMVQEPLDNYGDTKRILGKFILSQLGEIFTVESVVKVLGEAWINKQDVFKEPVFDPETEKPTLGPNGKLQLELNPGLVGQVINEVLNDAALGKYDITIGEGAYTETTRMANHMMLMDMAKSGLPIPPDILIRESNLPESSKSQILAALERMQEQTEKSLPGRGPNQKELIA